MARGRALVCEKDVSDKIVLPPSEMYYLVETTPRGHTMEELTYEEAFQLFGRLTHIREGKVKSTFESPMELSDELRKYHG